MALFVCIREERKGEGEEKVGKRGVGEWRGNHHLPTVIDHIRKG